MNIFGRRLSEYVEFSRLLLIVIPVVGITRLVLSLSGMPNSSVEWFSMTALMWIGVVYYSIRVHTSGFGDYKQLLVIFLLLNLASQAVSISGIVLAILTDTGNIYSAPEFAFGGNGKSWFHAGAHLILGTTMGSLVPWLFGSVILYLTRKVSRDKSMDAPGTATV